MVNVVDKLNIKDVKKVLKNINAYSNEKLESECTHFAIYTYRECKSKIFRYYVWKLVNLSIKKRGTGELYFAKAILYENKKNKEKLLEYLDIADKKGSISAWWYLAQEYTRGWIVNKDKELANKYYDKIIETASHGDLVSIARMFESKGSIIEDHNKALEIYKKSALMGNKVSIMTVILYYNDLVFKDKVDENLSELVEAGEYTLNVEKTIQIKHEEMEEKIKKAKKEDLENLYYWTKVGADFKNRDAIFYLGYYHLNGIGCQKSETQAFHYYKEAAELGCNSAYYMLGVFYFYGDVIDKNHKEALKWFMKANASGDRLEKMGDIYYLDEGVPQDYTKAFTYYYRALEYKLPSIYYKLGICYEYGQGCDINYDKAREYYELALDNGYEDAREKLENEKIKIEV